MALASQITHLGDFYDHSFAYTRRTGLYTGPASYVTGGDPLGPEQLSLGKIEHFDFSAGWTGVSSSIFYTLVYDRINKKVIWVDPATHLEVAASTNLSTYTADFEVVGK